MDPIKEAFGKVKQEIATLQHEMQQTNQQIQSLNEIIINLSQQISALQQTNTSQLPTNQHTETSYNEGKTPLSTGNEGVPTNKPTNQQTNKHSGNEGVSAFKPAVTRTEEKLNELSSLVTSFHEAQTHLKKQFTSLTKQEFTVYATIYQLQLEQKAVEYRLLAQKLGLTEISVRDYTLKLLKKGVPLLKIKHNNKKVLLAIPEALTQIASLPALLALYEKQ